MSAEASNDPAPRGSARADSVRAASLLAAATLHRALTRRAEESSRPAVIALGLVAAGAAVALAHLTGADVRASIAGGQPHALHGLVRALSRPGTAEL